MKKSTRLVWKLSAVVILILATAITFAGFLTDVVCAHYSLESARAVLRFNSDSMIKGIGKLMMTRNNKAIRELMTDMSRESSVFGDIQLVSHYTGEIVASRFGDEGGPLVPEDRPCAICHSLEDPSLPGMAIQDQLFKLPQGGRALCVIAPITNQESCRNAACHAHDKGPSILGFLNTDYSLRSVDAQVAERRVLIFGTVLVVILLCTGSFWILFRRIFEKPVRDLIAGTRRIAKRDLNFQFPEDRSDEIGLLQKSFNAMTSRLRAHQTELLDTMEYLEGIVENSADIIITVNPEGLIQTFNRGAEQVLGYKRDEVIGKRIETLFADPREREVAIARLRYTDNVTNYETQFLAKNGEPVDVLLTLSRLRDKEGNPLGTFGISKDVTRERWLFKQLIQSKKFAAIGQTVTGIQHSIKNMLNTLKGGVYMVRTGLKKEKREWVDDGLGMIDEGIDKITHLSRHMLDYAKDWKLELEQADLGNMLKEIHELNREGAADDGVTLLIKKEDHLPSVRCDPKLVHMAVMDLLTNAIEACNWRDYPDGESPQVALKAYTHRGGYLFVIEVSDNGCGMDENVQQNLFKPFFSTKKRMGTGLGLSMTSRIIHLHGGNITVESEPDKGSTFRIQLPFGGPDEDRQRIDGEDEAGLLES